MAVYAALAALVNPATNSHAVYNAKQLRSIGVVNRILFACENDENARFPGLVVLNMVRLIHYVLDTPERSDDEVVTDTTELVQFLIATHAYRKYRARVQMVYANSPIKGGVGRRVAKYANARRVAMETAAVRARSNSLTSVPMSPGGVAPRQQRRSLNASATGVGLDGDALYSAFCIGM